MLTHTLLWHGEDSTPQVLTESMTGRKNLMNMQSIAERHFELDDVHHHTLLAINCAR
jgi:gamma-tubulin complex component 5